MGYGYLIRSPGHRDYGWEIVSTATFRKQYEPMWDENVVISADKPEPFVRAIHRAREYIDIFKNADGFMVWASGTGNWCIQAVRETQSG